MPVKLIVQDNFKAIEREFKVLRKKFPKEVDRMAKTTADLVKGELQKVTPRQTNKLANSYFTRKLGDADYLISNNARSRSGFEYIDALEFGTGIFGPKKRVIKPKRGKVLRFRDIGRRGSARLGISKRKGSGKIIFARSVKGIKPFRMFKKTEPKIPQIAKIVIEARLRALIRKFNQLRPAVR